MVSQLASIIFAFCSVYAVKENKDNKWNQRRCWDYQINCMVDNKGSTNKELIKSCIDKYKNGDTKIEE